MWSVEPNQPGSYEGSNNDPRIPMNSNNKEDNRGKGNSNRSNVVGSDDPAPGSVLRPSTLNLDDSNLGQDSPKEVEIFMEGQTQKSKQEKPTTRTETTESGIQQVLTNVDDQATLTDQPRSDRSSGEDMEGRIGISLHGSYCHGLRTLLTITGSAQKTKVKVVQSAGRH